jgi:hypothetical protein
MFTAAGGYGKKESATPAIIEIRPVLPEKSCPIEKTV